MEDKKIENISEFIEKIDDKQNKLDLSSDQSFYFITK